MGLRICFVLLLFFLFLGFATPSTYIIKYEVLQNPGRTTGRSLLQQKRDCPLDMENMNYSIVTSQCKGPHYTAQVCCRAFKELSCQYRDVLNTGTNNCPVIMFNYLHLYGKYPPGLFSNLCKEGKQGLDCKDIDELEQQRQQQRQQQQQLAQKSAAAPIIGLQSSLIPLFLGFLFLLQI